MPTIKITDRDTAEAVLRVAGRPDLIHDRVIVKITATARPKPNPGKKNPHTGG